MFSIIRSNQRKSAVLIVLLGTVLGATGFAFGAWLDPSFGPFGLLVALGVWLILLLTSFAGGESMLMAQAGGREIVKQDAPQLFNIVEEMQIAAGLAQPPKIFVIDSTIPNAFAVGRNERRAAIGVTTGLLARLNRDELQGVVAHEIAHIKHRDTLFMTLAGTTLGAVIMLADLFVRGLRFSSINSRRNSSNRNNNGAALVLVFALVMAIVAPLLAQLLYFACSRRREYLADAGAAQFTRYPEGLASALEKIAGAQRADAPASRVLAPLYIVNPQAAHGGGGGWLSTHPATEDRIRVLRGMGGMASMHAYETAYKKLHGGRNVLGALAESNVEEPARGATPGEETLALPPGWRAARGVLHEADNARVIDCSCGLRIRIPPAWQGSEITCPRCGHVHRA